MNRLQMNLYEFLTHTKKVDILVVKNQKEGREAQQIFRYLKKPSLLLPDLRIEKFEDLRPYQYELFEIYNSFDQYYFSDNLITLIIPSATFQHPLPSKQIRKPLSLSFGDILEIELLEQIGYIDTGIVQNRGEFSFHSNRLDIYPINSNNPFRISLSEDMEIEEIREFSPVSQLKLDSDEVENIDIAPATFSLSKKRYKEILEEIENLSPNSPYSDIRSYGLWFLKDDELLDTKFKKIFHYSEIPQSKDLYDFQLEDIPTKREIYQKSNILLDDLVVGDYIVHKEHGIGIFEGLTQEKILGGLREFVKIRYQGDNHLLIPIEKLDLLSRYISATGSTPKLDRLGKGGFSKRSQKVRSRLHEIAKYIVELSAKRQLIEAPKIEKIDISPIRQQAGFIYTEDQIRAIDEILENLSKGYPMEHLLIGDVGFGKTEVAINIIYSVIKSGFQVAFLVPTTLLAKQHYTSIKSRLEKFGITIAHIDSFVSPKEKREIKKGVEQGNIDLIIGTHTILDFKFSNLALLIIDEEHKFGVKQKSKIQTNHSNIHLLSMSATPIPRTLHSALSNLKTISKLETPPNERVGVRTFLKEYDEAIIKNAILKELRRGGQVFYIFNSIAEIENKREELLNLLPSLKILIGHSKVPSKTLEREIVKFAEGEYDLLLSTSIIGAGIHIPNANTILIDGADRFGIADLHQLRGRVGRGDREGFCYFFIEDFQSLTENSRRRLKALEENSHLGSGNSLAMHDLEIRGGGNIAGESQSGHINDVGYSFYIQMLEDEIRKLTIGEGEIDEVEQDIELQLSIDGYISSELVPEERIRIEIYRRATSSQNLEDIQKIELELRDRFGKLDTPTIQFLDLLRIKILGKRAGVKFIQNRTKDIYISFWNGQKAHIKSPTRDDDDILKTILEWLKGI
ncbi:MAG TPA: DEAD/DEAH box helicase [Campylobacterales bacterium]|nr:DEAD/DEAH box helicase [Campylobacterales bacterium]